MNKTRSLHDTNWRWLALFFQTFMTFGGYYIYDTPQALQSKFQAPPYNYSNLQFNVLYSIYLFPNLVLPFVGGVLVDYFGVRTMLIIYVFLTLLGQWIFTVGASGISYALLLLGRFVFALGGENCSIAQSIITAKWFQKTGVSFAFGINVLGGRTASLINSFFTPKIAESSGSVWFPCLGGVIICSLSMFAGLGATWMDYKSDLAGNGISSNSSSRIGIKGLKGLNSTLWLLALHSAFAYASIACFLSNANDILVKRHAFSGVAAGDIICIIYVISIIVSPMAGLIVDRFGGKLTAINLAAGLLCLSHLIFAFLPDYQIPSLFNIIVPIVIFSIGFAVYSTTFWAILPDLVEEELIGTLYGLVTAGINGITAIWLIIAGAVQDETKEYKSGYFYSELLAGFLTLCALGVGLMIKHQNMRQRVKGHAAAEPDVLLSKSEQKLLKLEKEPQNSKFADTQIVEEDDTQLMLETDDNMSYT